MQEQTKNIPEGCQNCLEKIKMQNGVYSSFRSIKHENSLVKQRKIAWNTVDDERFSFNKNNSLPLGYVLPSWMTQGTVKFSMEKFVPKNQTWNITLLQLMFNISMTPGD